MSSELLDLERQRCAAYDAMDTAAFERLLADDYIHVHGVGGIVDKSRDEYLATMATKTPGRSEATRSDLVVRDYGDFAIIAGPLHMQIWPADGSAKKEIHANAHGTWRRIDGQWKATSFQVTPVTPRN